VCCLAASLHGGSARAAPPCAAGPDLGHRRGCHRLHGSWLIMSEKYRLCPRRPGQYGRLRLIGLWLLALNHGSSWPRVWSNLELRPARDAWGWPRSQASSCGLILSGALWHTWIGQRRVWVGSAAAVWRCGCGERCGLRSRGPPNRGHSLHMNVNERRRIAAGSSLVCGSGA